MGEWTLNELGVQWLRFQGCRLLDQACWFCAFLAAAGKLRFDSPTHIDWMGVFHVPGAQTPKATRF